MLSSKRNLSRPTNRAIRCYLLFAGSTFFNSIDIGGEQKDIRYYRYAGGGEHKSYYWYRLCLTWKHL
ncbi:MAG: hypothetical protein ABI378_04840, partial [Chitinophagaceae bacterium]